MKSELERPQFEQIIASIIDLQPWLRDQQALAEQERRIPQETIERLDAIGIFGVSTPKRFGGTDFSTREMLALYRTLAAGCGATSWVVWATAGGNMWSNAFADEVVAPVYESSWVGNRTFAVGGTSRHMSGSATRVEGGWMVKGAWPFATGSVHASHGYLAVFYDDSDDSKVGMVLIPKDQLISRNDWDAMGLAATGSQTMATDGELFVPDERFGFPARLAERTAELIAEGIGPRRGGLPRSIVSSTGVALGMADQALEVFLASIGRRSVPYSPYTRQLESPVAHSIIGQAAMRIRAAGRMADAAVAEFDRLDEEGVDPTAEQIVQFHTDAAWIWNECASAIETLFRASGASAISKRMPLQLIARNCRAGSLHAANNVDTWMENLGRSLAGAEAGPSSMSVLERRS